MVDEKLWHAQGQTNQLATKLYNRLYEEVGHYDQCRLLPTQMLAYHFMKVRLEETNQQSNKRVVVLATHK